MKTILVTALSFQRFPDAITYLEKQGFQVLNNDSGQVMSETALLEMVKEKKIDAMIVGNDAVSERVIQAASPTLKVIARSGVGYNTIDVAAAQRQQVLVTNTPGSNADSVADLTLGLIVALARNICVADRELHAGNWVKSRGIELQNKILGIIGTGHIGEKVIRRATGFGMKIVACAPRPRQELVDNYQVRYLSLPDLLKEADFVSLHMPATATTRGMICRDTLRLMKSTAYLVNTARGELIIEDDLYWALREEKIAGAALDVFVDEPRYRPELAAMPNVLLTPHIGASTREAAQQTAFMAAQEVVRVLSGKAPQHLVTVQR